MTHLERSPFDAELAASPRWVLGLMLGGSLLLSLLVGLQPAPRAWMLGTVILLMLTATLGWALTVARPRSAAWLATAGPAAIIFYASTQPGGDELLALLAMTIILGTTLISLPAALLLSILHSAGLLILVAAVPSVSAARAVVAVIAVWIAYGAMASAYRPIRHLASWSWQYYRAAQTRLEEAQTDRAEAERTVADLVHAHRQLSLAHEREAALRQAADDARQDKARFAARVSHEFRTPLNIIIGMVSLMVERPHQYGAAIPPRLMEHLKAVYRNCRHLASMIDDVLDLSQAEAGRVRLHKEQVSLPDLIESAVNVIRPLVEQKGLLLNVEMAADLPLLACDRIRIRQVLLNLLGNAARATDRGSITVRVSAEGGHILLLVTDTGTGMAPEDAARIFEPFVQGDNNPGGTRGGSGLGLSISKQFVELHEGRIWLESELGRGTTFYVTLPLADAPPPRDGPARWNMEEWKWMEGRSRPALPDRHYRPRLLLWDTTGGLADATESVEDVEIITVEDAAAWSAQARETVHAAIVNAYPPADLEALLAIARPALPDAPVLGCTFLSREAHAERQGVLAYVTKPLSLSALERAVRKLPAAPKRVLIVDDDPDAREVMQLALQALDPGMSLTTAADGASALELLTASQPDLLLLDVIMPGLSGWEVLAAKQQIPALRPIPTIIVSAQDVIEGPLTSDRLHVTAERGFTGGQVVACALAVGTVVLGR